MKERANAAALRGVLDALGGRFPDLQARIRTRLDGGSGSGNWGHSGRPGLRGGSMPGGGVRNRYGTREAGFSNRAKRTRLLQECRDSMDTCKEAMRKVLYSHGGSTRADMLKELRAEAASAPLTAAKKRLQTRQKELEKLERLRGKHTSAELEERIRKNEQALKKHPGDEDLIQFSLKQDRNQLQRVKDVEDTEREIQTLEKGMQSAKEQLKSLKAEDYSRADTHELVEQYNVLAEDCYKKALGAFRSAGDCETVDDATAYLRAKKFYQDHGGNFVNDTAVDLSGMTNGRAVATAKRLESLFTEYPMLKGKLAGVITKDLGDRPYGQCDRTFVILNRKRFGKKDGSMERSQRRDETQGFHPPDMDETSVIAHETGHAIEQAIMNQSDKPGERVADEVMRRTVERVYGSYTPEREYRCRSNVSGYAATNPGTNGNERYGRNTEFLAEAFAEYKTSPTPREVSRIAGEELEKIMKERL